MEAGKGSQPRNLCLPILWAVRFKERAYSNLDVTLGPCASLEIGRQFRQFASSVRVSGIRCNLSPIARVFKKDLNFWPASQAMYTAKGHRKVSNGFGG